MADQLGRSVGDMYAGAFIPSIIQIIPFCGCVAIVSVFWPDSVPALPEAVGHPQGLGALEAVHAGNDAVTRTDLPCAGHDLHGRGDADRSGAMGAAGAIALAGFTDA